LQRLSHDAFEGIDSSRQICGGRLSCGQLRFTRRWWGRLFLTGMSLSGPLVLSQPSMRNAVVCRRDMSTFAHSL
jgi:hypothetical protein